MTVQQIAMDLNEDVAQKLAAIPSAVTPLEQQLALHYITTLWDGTANIFENGPLLGGATRALGMGMMFNENRESDSLLHTYDWFSLREPLDLQPDVWTQLVARNLLKQSEVEAAQAKGTFLPLFKALHRNEDYWNLVRPHVGYLPGHRDDSPEHGEAIFTTPEWEFGTCYIDGCKSWYGTKHWFQQIVPSLLPNTDIIFQDFGHYTCFWLPMLVSMFRDRFELKAYVHHTYVWRLRDVPTEAEVEATFPDEPENVSREVYDEIFINLHNEALTRNDRYHVLLTQMQRAAAYAYIGLLDESREILDALLLQSEWLPIRPYLKQARISPTYRPEGRIEL